MTLELLSSIVIAAFVLLIVLMIIVLRKLGRIERQLTERRSKVHATPESEQSVTENRESDAMEELSGPFLDFLNEDPARRELPKKEQFAAYRRWRSERGLNWKTR